MTFSDYALGLMPYISCGKEAPSYFIELIGNFIDDAVMDSCELLKHRSDTKYRYIKGVRPIKPKAAQFLYDHRNKRKFISWISDRIDDTESYDKIEEWLKRNNIIAEYVPTACAELLENILLEIISANSIPNTAHNDSKQIRALTAMDETNNPAANYIENYRLPRYNISELRYDAENTCFCGRENEIQRLTSFINDEKPLLWWAITGNGGVGKSRLAYEFTKSLNAHQNVTFQGEWKAVMVEWRSFYAHIKTCLENMIEWEAAKNYLITIDYVQSFEQEIANFIQSLACLSWSSSKVRVLLIERARKTKGNEKNTYEPLWYRTFKSGWNNVDWLNNTCFDPMFIDLQGLNHDSAVSIVKSYVSSKKRQITSEECNDLIRYVDYISANNTLPLLLLCATETWLESPDTYTKPECLSSSLVWKQIIEKEKKEIVQNNSGIIAEALIDFHIVATIIHRLMLKEETIVAFFEIERFRRYQHFKDEIISLLYGSKYVIRVNYDRYICGIEPDIIGEYFVYTVLQDYTEDEYRDFFSCLIDKSESETARFFWRYFSDFNMIASEHPGYQFLASLVFDSLKNEVNGIVSDALDKQLSDETAEKMTFTAPNSDGEETLYEVLFTFDSDETGKSYMVYTDDSKDENGNIRVFASAYTIDGDQTELMPIETATEWKIIETILNSLQESANE